MIPRQLTAMRMRSAPTPEIRSSHCARSAGSGSNDTLLSTSPRCIDPGAASPLRWPEPEGEDRSEDRRWPSPHALRRRHSATAASTVVLTISSSGRTAPIPPEPEPSPIALATEASGESPRGSGAGRSAAACLTAGAPALRLDRVGFVARRSGGRGGVHDLREPAALRALALQLALHGGRQCTPLRSRSRGPLGARHDLHVLVDARVAGRRDRSPPRPVRPRRAQAPR